MVSKMHEKCYIPVMGNVRGRRTIYLFDFKFFIRFKVATKVWYKPVQYRAIPPKALLPMRLLIYDKRVIFFVDYGTVLRLKR